MFDATQLPTEPCDPAALEQAQKPEQAPEYVRAPDGAGHEAALQQGGKP